MHWCAAAACVRLGLQIFIYFFKGEYNQGDLAALSLSNPLSSTSESSFHSADIQMLICSPLDPAPSPPDLKLAY